MNPIIRFLLSFTAYWTCGTLVWLPRHPSSDFHMYAVIIGLVGYVAVFLLQVFGQE